MQKLLLAGGAGYIGTVLAARLVELGYQVEVIDELWFGNYLPPEIRVTKRDLFGVTDDDLRGFDQVIFLGGVSNDPMAEFSPSANFIYNAALPTFLAYRAKQAGVRRFVYASSCSVYGYTVNQLYDESAPATCHYPYGISKLQGEQGVMMLCNDTFSVICLRQGTVCGHSPRMRFDLVVNTMFKTAILDDAITVNNPSLWRPLYHIEDAATGFIRAIQANNAISGIYNVASDNFTIGQVGDIVKAEVERLTGKRIRMILKNIADLRNYKVSIQKARTELGFQPRYSIESIVRDLHANLDSYGDLNQDCYYNIRVFTAMQNRKAPDTIERVVALSNRAPTD